MPDLPVRTLTPLAWHQALASVPSATERIACARGERQLVINGTRCVPESWASKGDAGAELAALIAAMPEDGRTTKAGPGDLTHLPAGTASDYLAALAFGDDAA
jgi:hypothetical protein